MNSFMRKKRSALTILRMNVTFAECWQAAPEANGQTDTRLRSDQCESWLAAEVTLGVYHIVVLGAINESIACGFYWTAATHHTLGLFARPRPVLLTKTNARSYKPAKTRHSIINCIRESASENKRTCNPGCNGCRRHR